MSDVAIRVEGLGKRYRIGAQQQRHDTLRDAIVDGVNGLKVGRLKVGRSNDDNLQPATLQPSTPQPSGRDTDFWALKDVSFEVKTGEVVGVIGRNGAGKSTLLKILSRITEPTEGRAEIHGRVGSLLEVGTGFHPELTGRENIFLNGAILGMRRTEIAARFDEIVAFSEIEKFLDTPVKRYSSGMYVRLAFAVAAHLEPEILLVDEVLAVGDAAFQRKCLGKMEDVASEGRTVLFVSHNMAAIQKLCRESLLLRSGRLFRRGLSSDVTADYLQRAVEPVLHWERSHPDADGVNVRRVTLVDEDSHPLPFVTTATALIVNVEFEVITSFRDLQLSIGLVGAYGQAIFDTSPQDDGLAVPCEPGLYEAWVRFPAGILQPTLYGIKVFFWLLQGGVLDGTQDITFTVEEAPSLANSRPGGRPGVLVLPCDWQIHRSTVDS